MNGCKSIQAKFTEYLDGRLNGREMQRIAAHVDSCRECGEEWVALKRTQATLSALGPIQAPDGLLQSISAAVKQERVRQQRGIFYGWQAAWRGVWAPFLFQASAGLASAVLLMGSVIALGTMVVTPDAAHASKDEPLGEASAPRLLYLSSGAGENPTSRIPEPVVVEAYVNGTGKVYDYRIVTGPNDLETRAKVENMLLYSVFEPAKSFGQPVRGVAIFSFAGVSVRG